MKNYQNFINYFFENHSNSLFYQELQIEGKLFSFLYTYDYLDEMNSFESSFLNYLPFYVWSIDSLENVPIDNNISTNLKKMSTTIWKNKTIIPDRNLSSMGLFGELFLDFYMRVVKKHKTIITYASKKAFNSEIEVRGYDNVLYSIVNGKIELYLCEAKFVSSKNNAKQSLLSDINGNGNHFNESYLNRYMDFIVAKGFTSFGSERLILSDFISSMNNVLISGKMKYLDYLINEGIKVNFVLFAMFQDTNKSINDYESIYDQLNLEMIKKIDKMKISNYSTKIVFIPTDNKSMVLKEHMVRQL